MKSDGTLTLEEPETAITQLGVQQHTVRFTSTVTLQDQGGLDAALTKLQEAAQAKLKGSSFTVSKTADCELRVVTDVRVSWAYSDDFLGSTILQAFQAL